MNHNITSPTLLLDKKKCLRNIEDMTDKAFLNKIALRPHFKTHQSKEIGNWFRDFGVKAITVSSLKMAEYFAEDGWNDITVAFPTNILEINTINKLAQKIQLNLLVEDIDTIIRLQDKLEYSVHLFIKIDVGTHRTGIQAYKKELLTSLTQQIDKSDKTVFKGFLAHAGHTYHAREKEQILEIHEESKSIMLELKEYFLPNYPNLILSVGDTPSCSVADNFEGLDEIRPGNFVFYDVMQNFITSCSTKQIAVALACPVVAKHEDRFEIVLYGGAVHLSKDHLYFDKGAKFFGNIVFLEENSWSDPIDGMYLASLSQEHGIIKASQEYFDKVNVGDVIGILPVHSCLTVNELKKLVTLDGEIIECMKS
ncbi:alanine racemase [Sediminitomix flava]|uniref:D-serine deaminase-like pyridoxal phosphate-dependent protein n=1 Tax=Sediminitomix flava TaxID=379075 RepID=A0A315Z9B1_SEDFL|nr:alanine racemase [Sediminitomix flava]PWJ42155.1 D-serine deaminase-like pyridoxal phosphate-dependent protein [Sediminitomix flava]